MTLLLTVISNVALYAAGDSINASSYFKMVAMNDAFTYRMMYQAPQTSNVKISLLDNKNNIVYKELLSDTEGFVKVYDLSAMQDGTYTFVLESNGVENRQTIQLDDWDADDVIISSTQDKKVAFLGKIEQDFTLNIIDQSGKSVYTEQYESATDLNRLFNLQQVEGDEVSFVLSRGNKIVRQSVVKL
ncbi:MAG: hypothetical protein ACJAZM_002248 [Cyclobacteriaceae bacterium]|jgi:hypothetical protein